VSKAVIEFRSKLQGQGMDLPEQGPENLSFRIVVSGQESEAQTRYLSYVDSVCFIHVPRTGYFLPVYWDFKTKFSS
jgi:hypothetical protein